MHRILLITAAVILTLSFSYGQITVSGTVTSEDRRALIGISILEKGTSNGTITDIEGKFTLTVTSQESVLVISYLGFQTQEVVVDRPILNIVFSQTDIDVDDDVIVIEDDTAEEDDLVEGVDESFEIMAFDYYGDEFLETSEMVLTVDKLIEDYNLEATLMDLPNEYNSDSIEQKLNEELSSGELTKLKVKLLTNALYLTDNSNFSYYGKDGLAYVWGSKNSEIKVVPSRRHGQKNICPDTLYGLDCSGFMYEIMTRSGLNLPDKPRRYANAAWLSNPINWNKPLSEYLNCDSCFSVICPNITSIDQIQSGDIFYFRSEIKAYHIGIVLSYDDKLIVFESQGNPDLGCTVNIKRGPRLIELTKNLVKNKRYGIVRIMSK